MRWRSLLTEAIKQQKLVEFLYDDNIWRKAEPHTIGLNLAGNFALSAFRTKKNGHPFEQPDWRTYLDSKIVDMKISTETFKGPRPGFNPNPKTFRRVFAQIGSVLEAEL